MASYAIDVAKSPFSFHFLPVEKLCGRTLFLATFAKSVSTSAPQSVLHKDPRERSKTCRLKFNLSYHFLSILTQGHGMDVVRSEWISPIIGSLTFAFSCVPRQLGNFGGGKKRFQMVQVSGLEVIRCHNSRLLFLYWSCKHIEPCENSFRRFSWHWLKSPHRCQVLYSG